MRPVMLLLLMSLGLRETTACLNECSGNGNCNDSGECDCYDGVDRKFGRPDCSEEILVMTSWTYFWSKDGGSVHGSTLGRHLLWGKSYANIGIKFYDGAPCILLEFTERNSRSLPSPGLAHGCELLKPAIVAEDKNAILAMTAALPQNKGAGSVVDGSDIYFTVKIPRSRPRLVMSLYTPNGSITGWMQADVTHEWPNGIQVVSCAVFAVIVWSVFAAVWCRTTKNRGQAIRMQSCG